MTTYGDRLYHLGGVPVGLLDELCPANVHILVKPSTSSTTYNSYEHWLARWPKDKLWTKVSEAEDACITKQNDVILVTPESHAWYGDTHSKGEALTWDKHNTHLIGMSPFTKGGAMRSRFGHSGYTMTNFMTVSGSSNMFANIYWMHGSSEGGADDIRMVTVSGHRNVFRGCHFSGPNDTTQSASGNYKGITVTGSHNYFKDCIFGAFNLAKRGANSQLDFTGVGQGNVFEDCIFVCGSGGTTTEFIAFDVTAQQGACTAFFLNCQFVNMYEGGSDGTIKIADAITVSTTAETNDSRLFFDSRCSFAGVTDVVVAGKEQCIRFAHATQTYAQQAASPDYKSLGLAKWPESS